MGAHKGRKFHAVMQKQRRSVSATMSADRAPPSISAISPKWSPALRLATTRSPMRTRGGCRHR